jgi:hypothetical protein
MHNNQLLMGSSAWQGAGQGASSPLKGGSQDNKVHTPTHSESQHQCAHRGLSLCVTSACPVKDAGLNCQLPVGDALAGWSDTRKCHPNQGCARTWLPHRQSV